VQIILPGLFDLPLDELDADFVTDKLPGLNRILRLSTTHQNQDFSIDALLSSALALRPTAGIAADRADGLAMAQAFATDTDQTTRLLLAQAIHLRADMHGAIAVPISENAENKNDITNIIKDLNELFKVDCNLSEIIGGCYLLQLKAFDAPLHYPHPLSVLGKNVNPFVEQSRQVLPWYQLINEFQMFMHQHPVNEKRQKMGRLPINSLWVWGAGVRPTTTLQPAWYCDDPLLNQFAASLDLKVGPCSSVAASSDLEDAVVVDLRLLQLLKSGIDQSLDELLLDIEAELLAPVLQKITQRPQPLWLRAGYKLDFELKPGARFKFWRRPGSLYDWCQSEP
jgi:hypothetical protein